MPARRGASGSGAGSSWQVLGLRRQEAVHQRGRLGPGLGFRAKPAAAARGEAVEPGAAVVLGDAPVRGNGAFVLELEQNGIERALIDGQQIAADLLDASRDAVAVQLAEHVEGSQDDQVKSALLNVALAHPTSCWFPTRLCHGSCGKATGEKGPAELSAADELTRFGVHLHAVAFLDEERDLHFET